MRHAPGARPSMLVVVSVPGPVFVRVAALVVSVVVFVTMGWTGVQRVADPAEPTGAVLGAPRRGLAPARTAQLETRRGKKLAQSQSATFWTLALRGLTGSLQHVEAVATGLALVLENRHGCASSSGTRILVRRSHLPPRQRSIPSPSTPPRLSARVPGRWAIDARCRRVMTFLSSASQASHSPAPRMKPGRP